MARVLAVVAVLSTPPKGMTQVTNFEALMKQHGCEDSISDVNHYIHSVHRRFVKHKTVFDAPRSGRPRKISDQVARMCRTLLLQGELVDNVRVPFSSMKDAVKRSPEIAMLKAQCNCTNKQMWKAVRDIDPLMRKAKRQNKPFLKPEVKEARVEAAERGLNLSEDEVKDVVFIDEVTVTILPEEFTTVICRKGDVILPAEDARLLRTKKPIRVSGIFAVNARLGAVYWAPLSGTTGLKTQFTVSPQPCLFFMFHTSKTCTMHVTPPACCHCFGKLGEYNLSTLSLGAMVHLSIAFCSKASALSTSL